MDTYYELATFRTSNRNQLILSSDIRAIVEVSGTSPLFRSVFTYTPDILTYLKNNRSVAAYKGIRGIENIPIDIDKKSNSDEFTLEKMRGYLSKLDKLGVDPDAYQVYFSGTGYHIFLSNHLFGFEPSEDLPLQVGLTLKNLDLIDDVAVMRGSQLIRMEHSLNEKSNLFKIPLTTEESRNATAEQILELAKTQRLDFVYVDDQDKDYERWGLEKYVVTPQTLPSHDIQVAPSRKNKSMPSCIETLYNQGPIEGCRNEAILRIASHYNRLGLTPQAIKTLLIEDWSKKTNASLDPVEIAKKVDYVCAKAYTYGCNNTLLMKYCNRSCKFYTRKNMDDKPLLDVHDMDERFMEYCEKRERADEFINLRHIFGLERDVVLWPGEVCIFQGDTGVNKTSIIQNIMLGVNMLTGELNPMKIPMIYYGPELSEGSLQLRHYCIASGENEETIIANRDPSYLRQFHKYMDHITIQKNLMSLKEIERTIVEKAPSVIFIDYYEQIQHDSFDKSTSIAIGQIAKELAIMAANHNVAVVGVSQINRQSAYDGKTGVHSGFGSGAIEKTARRLITIEGDQTSPIRKLNMVKSNNDASFSDIILERQSNWRFKRIR